jgi:hypothetical protein
MNLITAGGLITGKSVDHNEEGFPFGITYEEMEEYERKE